MSDNRPAYRVYTIVDRYNSDPFWLNIGIAFPHRDTKGINLILQALPLDGKLVLRDYREAPPEGTRVVTIPKGKKKVPEPAQA